MADSLTWLSEERCTVGDVVFQTLPTTWLRGAEASMDGADFFLMKDPASAERFAALVADVRPRNTFELGIYAGGSTVLLCELATPRCLVAIDNRAVNPALRDYLGRRGLDAVVHVHGRRRPGERAAADRACRRRVRRRAARPGRGRLLAPLRADARIVQRVVPALASRRCLSARGLALGPHGGWRRGRWLLAGRDTAHPPDLEIVLAVPSVPGLISEVSVDGGCVRIRRGDAAVDSRGFDIATCCKPRGRRLLA
jgi:hypothetical protein